MNYRTIVTTLVAAAALTAAPASAQNVGGTWQITSEGRRGPQTQTLVLAVEGSTLTGTLTFGGGGRRGGGGGGRGPQAPLEITDGTVDGNAFSFMTVLDFGGGSITLSYSGTVDGDTMAGERTVTGGGRGGGQPAPFTGTRGG